MHVSKYNKVSRILGLKMEYKRKNVKTCFIIKYIFGRFRHSVIYVFEYLLWFVSFEYFELESLMIIINNYYWFVL